jgi:hypothetical protein
MAKPPTPDDLYRFGRSYPNGQAHERRHPSPPRASDYGQHEEIQKPQAPEDQRAAGYHNDVADNWLRGGGKGGATGKPSFDKSNAWRMKDSNDWHSGHDPAVIRKPVGEK